MSQNLYLTQEMSDLQPATGVYYRLKLGARSDNPSMTRSVTNTEAGASAGVQLTLSAGGTAISWITDRLSGTDLSATAWVLHAWAKESAAAANAAIRWQILPFTVAEQTAAIDNNAGTELGTSSADVAITSAAATATTLADGNRLVLKILIDDAGTMGASQTVTVSFNGQYPGAEGDSYVVCPDNIAVTAAVPATTLTRIRNKLLDTDGTNPLIDDSQLGQAMDSAVEEYSRDRPWLAVAALSGDGSAVDFVLPGRWVRGMSTIREIEYPTGNQPRTIVESQEYEIVESVLGTQPTRKLHFVTGTPESGTENILVRYTTRHVHTDELDTVPAQDLDALCMLAGAYGALSLAAKAASSQDPTINVDGVNRGPDETSRWLKVADALRAAYARAMGLSMGNGKDGALGSSVAAGFTFKDWDTDLSSGADRVFHGRRWR